LYFASQTRRKPGGRRLDFQDPKSADRAHTIRSRDRVARGSLLNDKFRTDDIKIGSANVPPFPRLLLLCKSNNVTTRPSRKITYYSGLDVYGPASHRKIS